MALCHKTFPRMEEVFGQILKTKNKSLWALALYGHTKMDTFLRYRLKYMITPKQTESS